MKASFSLLAVLILLSGIFANTALSQPATEGDIAKYNITKNDAANFVARSLRFYAAQSGWSGNLALRRFTVDSLPGPEQSLIQALLKDAILVVDVDQRPLFWRFQIGLKTGHTLRIVAAANFAIGTPIVSVQIGKARDWVVEKRLALNVATKLVKDIKSSATVVVYAYPRYGLLATTENGRRVVVDLEHLTLYQVPPRTDRYKSWRPEVWSPFDKKTLQELIWWVRHFGRIVQRRNELLGKVITFTSCPDEQPSLPGFERREQERAMWCAPAVAEMILDFYGFDITQEEARIEMDTSFTGGTAPGNEVLAYSALTGGAYEVQLDTSLDPTSDFDLIKEEICAQRPVRLGLPGHVVASAGYRAAESTSQLLIFNPGTGDIVAAALGEVEEGVEWIEWLSLMGIGSAWLYDVIFIKPSTPAPE